MPDVSDHELLRYHEAAHAVVGFHFSLQINKIVVDDSARTGDVAFQGAPLSRLPMALLLLAGGRGEKLRDPSAPSRRMSASDDEKHVYNIVADSLRRRTDEMDRNETVDELRWKVIERLSACTEFLLRIKWKSVMALASALEGRDEMLGDEAAEIIQKSNSIPS